MNHLLCLLDIRDKETGADLYPEFKEMEALLPDTHDRLTRTMFRTFGYWPSRAMTILVSISLMLPNLQALPNTDYDPKVSR
ncbi:MAG TPA: hypothetical protein VLK78_00695 [Candidatus Angelobacter sp.]|nr:hypothetical protein [Candidatus Angelobacter sp.]